MIARLAYGPGPVAVGADGPLGMGLVGAAFTKTGEPTNAAFGVGLGSHLLASDLAGWEGSGIQCENARS